MTHHQHMHRLLKIQKNKGRNQTLFQENLRFPVFEYLREVAVDEAPLLKKFRRMCKGNFLLFKSIAPKKLGRKLSTENQPKFSSN